MSAHTYALASKCIAIAQAQLETMSARSTPKPQGTTAPARSASGKPSKSIYAWPTGNVHRKSPGQGKRHSRPSPPECQGI